MSCIVAISDGKTVYMGADSAGTAFTTLDQVSCKTPKIHKEAGFIIGSVGSMRGLQLTINYLDFEEKEKVVSDVLPSATPLEVVASVVEDMRNIFKDFGHTKIEEGKENGDTFLIGYKGGIFLVQPEYDIMEPTYPYYCIGNGDSAAFGALYASRERIMPPEARITVALEAAEKFNAAVRSPWVIDHVGW